MAYGSSKGFHRYVNKTFHLQHRFTQLNDGRLDPKIPLPLILSTWFFALARRTPSTEQVGLLLKDVRWQRRAGFAECKGCPDTAARALDEVDVDELHELSLEIFFAARRAGILKEGPFGQRCVIVDLNELFSSEKVHCDRCQVREKTVVRNGQEQTVKEYFHQAVALVWADEGVAWPIGWELLGPGEGELTGAIRLLERLLPRLSKSVDLVMGDALYCCRPFFNTVKRFGMDALAICSPQAEMHQEMDLLVENQRGYVGANQVERWSFESEAWKKDVGQKLRVLHYLNHRRAKSYRHERSHLRIVTTASDDILPDAQGWRLGRSRWVIENGTFNLLTRDYALTHNYHHSTTAIQALLIFRSLALVLSWAYNRHATARSKDVPKTFVSWVHEVLINDWVRYLDACILDPLHSE